MASDRDRRMSSSGQALVEFAVALVPFLIALLGIVDFGRGIYVYNGTAQAAREIARVTSVHPYGSCTAPDCVLGTSTEVDAVIATQRSLIPGLVIDPTADISCVEMAAAGDPEPVVPDSQCRSGDWIRVSVTAPFSPVTAALLGVGPFTFSSVARLEVP